MTSSHSITETSLRLECHYAAEGRTARRPSAVPCAYWLPSEAIGKFDCWSGFRTLLLVGDPCGDLRS